MKRKRLLLAAICLIPFSAQAARTKKIVPPEETPPVFHVPMGTTSTPLPAEVTLTLLKRFQSYNSDVSEDGDVFDPLIHSPKSVRFSPDGKTFYVNCLEGKTTLVYDASTLKRTAVIEHRFDAADAALFSTDPLFPVDRPNANVFSGSPVESDFTHGGRYLWIPYYHRSYDKNSEQPSAVAAVDTRTNQVAGVWPTGILPKMIAASPDGRWLAVTHWGDNTVGLMDVSSDNLKAAHYVQRFVSGHRLKPSFNTTEKVDRDHDCGNCLRGTVFTPDGHYLLVARMGGDCIDVFDTENKTAVGTVSGMKPNIRHLLLSGDDLILSANKPGWVQKASLKEILEKKLAAPGKNVVVEDWAGAYVGKGARTVAATADGKYIFACVNEESRVVVVRSSDMKVIASVQADSFPVGMDLSKDGKRLIVTSQGRNLQGGHSVMVFAVDYASPSPVQPPAVSTATINGATVIPAASTATPSGK